MDIFYIDLLWKLCFVFEKTKNKQKRGRGRPIFLKNVFLSVCTYLGNEQTYGYKVRRIG